MHRVEPGDATQPGPVNVWLVLFQEQPRVLFCHRAHSAPYTTRSTGGPVGGHCGPGHAGHATAPLPGPSGRRGLGKMVQLAPHTAPVQGASEPQSITWVLHVSSTSGPVMNQAPAREASSGVV